MVSKKIKVYCDGGARNNPGPAAAGVVVTSDKGDVLAEYNKFLGVQTNNFAEYSAVLLALDNINKFKNYKIEFYLDSQLIVNQLKGLYKVKNANILPLYRQVVSKISDLDITFTHVLREYNKLADAQVNICLDKHTIDL